VDGDARENDLSPGGVRGPGARVTRGAGSYDRGVPPGCGGRRPPRPRAHRRSPHRGGRSPRALACDRPVAGPAPALPPPPPRCPFCPGSWFSIREAYGKPADRGPAESAQPADTGSGVCDRWRMNGVRLVGGPLDGTEMAERAPGSPDPGVWLVVPGWQAGAEYAPMPGGDPGVWWYLGPVWI